MAAFQGAVEVGALMLELDLHMTADEQILVIHDPELGRTVLGSGLIHETNWIELADLEAGSWFGMEFASEGIPLLSEVLESIPRNVELNLEIKEEGFEDPLRLDRFLNLFLGQIKGQENRILVSCFSFQILKALRDKNMKLRLGYLNHEPKENLHWNSIQDLGLFSYHLNFEQLTPEIINEIHSRSIQVYAYTPNSAKEILKLLQWAVDGLITDEVEAALELVKKNVLFDA